MGDGEKLLTYLNSALEVLLGLDIFPCVPKKVKFCCPVLLIAKPWSKNRCSQEVIVWEIRGAGGKVLERNWLIMVGALVLVVMNFRV